MTSMNRYLIGAIACLLLASGCKKSEIQHQNELPQGEPIEVALTLSLDQSQAVSRAQATTTSWEGDGFEAQITAEPIDLPQSKAVDDLKVANVWVLQFNGTESTAKLIYKSYIPAYTVGSTVSLLKATTANRVAIVANTFDAAWGDAFAVGTATWGTVSAATKAVATQDDVLRGTDFLPMSGTITGTLALGSTLNVSLTRTVVQVDVYLRLGADLKTTAMYVQLRNIPNATSWFPDDAAGVWPATVTPINYPQEIVTGITATSPQKLTYWVPINRRGTVPGTIGITRATNAPTGATYLSVGAGAWYYRVHLGGDFDTDYNLKANTKYTYSLTFKVDPAGTDSRAQRVYVEVGGLRWATGNLVADGANGCKVGAPTDGGLYFQFGSLIGYKGGSPANGATGVGMPPYDYDGFAWGGAAAWSWSNDAMVWPSELVGYPATYPSNAGSDITSLTDYYFNYSAAPWETDGQNIRGFALLPGTGAGTLGTGRYAALGVGDPCTYYLGDPWRTPTAVEYSALADDVANQGSWVRTPVVGRWLGVNPGTASSSVFFPASGYRDNALGGRFVEIESGAAYLSSSVQSAADCWILNFNRSGIYSPGYNFRSGAMPVRCVQPGPTVPNPPAASDYVTIGTLRWAKGNLVAVNETNCKVGAPTDYGVYFQFGSLVGWSGGTTGNGVGTGSPALDKAVWPSAMGAAKPAYTWQDNGAAGISTLSNYYFNYSMAPWDVENVNGNIGIFAATVSGEGSTTGDLRGGRYANLGVGDPCTYYLGTPWRTPTAAEYLTLLGTDGDNTNKAVPLKLTSHELYFPASGRRYNSDGAFDYVGTRCNYRSSSVGDAIAGYFLSVSSTSVNPQNITHRSTGMPVRCVSAL